MASRAKMMVLLGVAAAMFVIAPGVDARPVAGAPGCTLFPAGSPWNQRVDRLPVAAGSATLMKATGITRLHADFSDSDADGYGIPYNVVDADTPRFRVKFDYWTESDDIAYPIPANARIEGGGDRHLITLDRSSCRLNELFAAEQRDGVWHAGSGATWDLRSTALRPTGWTSADAAGLPILPGLARHEELAAGGIDHALRITLPRTQRAYLYPARHYASSAPAPHLAPMGMRLRVKASFATDGFSPQTRAILEAGKRYGFIVADNGSAGFISGAPAPGWDDDDLHALHDVPLGALEVVDTSSLPGTSKYGMTWGETWTSPTAKFRRVRAFLSRSDVMHARAVRGGKVVAHKRVALRQGLIQIDLPRIPGARYSLSIR